MYYLYIVECSDRTLYSGITTNLIRRLKEHNISKRGAKYTRSRRPVKLIYSNKYRSRSSATKAEIKMKKLSRAEKLDLINGHL